MKLKIIFLKAAYNKKCNLFNNKYLKFKRNKKIICLKATHKYNNNNNCQNNNSNKCRSSRSKRI